MDGLDLVQAIAIQSVLLSLVLIVLVARIWIRIRKLRATLNASDYAVIAGFVSCVAWIAVSGLALSDGLLSPDFTNVESDLSVEAGKALFAAGFMFDLAVWCPKFSLLGLYYQVFSKEQGNRKERIALHLLTIFVSCSLITILILDTVICPDVSDNWSADPTKCSAWFAASQLTVDYCLNLSTDLFLICLPFSMLRRIQMDRRTKIGLALTFSLGVITVTFCTARFVCGVVYFVYPPLLILLYTAEICTALIVVCLPILRVFLVGEKTQPENANNARIEAALQRLGTSDTDIPLVVKNDVTRQKDNEESICP